jgi:hypothetical protein
MDLQAIKRCLRVGLFPTEFGAQFIGDGAQRSAYLCGDYVIKRRAPAWQHDAESESQTPCPKRCAYDVPTAPLKRVGVCPPQQWFIKDWVIQPFYRPLKREEWQKLEWLLEVDVEWTPTRRKANRIRLDLACDNLGTHPVKGTIHCFDW